MSYDGRSRSVPDTTGRDTGAEASPALGRRHEEGGAVAGDGSDVAGRLAHGEAAYGVARADPAAPPPGCRWTRTHVDDTAAPQAPQPSVGAPASVELLTRGHRCVDAPARQRHRRAAHR